MNKKICTTLLIAFTIAAISFSCVFAADNMSVVEGIRNVVGGAENTIANVGNGIASGARNVTSGAENMMQDAGNTISQGAQNVGNGIQNIGSTMTAGTDNNTNYTATRTSVETTGNFLGMDPTMFTWIVMAVVGLAIIALVWVYGRQYENYYSHDENH